MRVWWPFLGVFACACVTLTQEGARVSVYTAPLDGLPVRRAMPRGCQLLSAGDPVSLTELEMEGTKDPYLVRRNQAAAAGANVLLVLSRLVISRHDFECPSSSPITDCPPSSGAWFDVVFQDYLCTQDALRILAATPAPSAPSQ